MTPGYCPVKTRARYMFQQNPQIRPDEHQPVGDTSIFSHPQEPNHCTNYKNNTGPDRFGNPPSIPSHAYQKHRNICDGRYRNPPEIHTKWKRNE
jgi:hypothetical protein